MAGVVMPEAAFDLLPKVLWAVALLYLTFRIVADGGIEEVAKQQRGKVSDKTIRRFRVLMYGTGYGLAAFGAVFLADTLLRIWRAFQQ